MIDPLKLYPVNCSCLVSDVCEPGFFKRRRSQPGHHPLLNFSFINLLVLKEGGHTLAVTSLPDTNILYLLVLKERVHNLWSPSTLDFCYVYLLVYMCYLDSFVSVLLSAHV